MSPKTNIPVACRKKNKQSFWWLSSSLEPTPPNTVQLRKAWRRRPGSEQRFWHMKTILFGKHKRELLLGHLCRPLHQTIREAKSNYQKIRPGHMVACQRALKHPKTLHAHKTEEELNHPPWYVLTHPGPTSFLRPAETAYFQLKQSTAAVHFSSLPRLAILP